MENYIKKGIFALLMILSFVSQSFACDACGCSSSGNYIGMLPAYSTSFVGVRYRMQHFEGSSLHSTSPSTDPHSENFHRTELWGRFYPAKRIQTMIVVPFQKHQITEEGITQSIHGLGDITALTHVAVINKSSAETNWKHTVLLGGGVKLATGKYMQRDKDKVRFIPQFQLGSGATNFLANAILATQYKNVGVNVEFGKWFNQTNELSYRFGNQTYISSTVYARKPVGGTSLLPSLIYNWERIEGDREYDLPTEFTGSTTSHLGGGLTLIRTKWSANIFATVPVHQQLAEGASQNKIRFSLGFQYLIGS